MFLPGSDLRVSAKVRMAFCSVAMIEISVLQMAGDCVLAVRFQIPRQELLNMIVFNIILPLMDGSDLTREQIEKMQGTIAPTSQYLRRVVERMEETGFPIDDTIRQATERAQDALHGLWIHLHYLKCKGQTGIPYRQRPRESG